MLEQLQNRASKTSEEIDSLREKIAATEESLQTKEEELTSLQKRRDDLFAEKVNSDVYRKREELERQIENLEKERKAIERSQELLLGLIKSVWYTWREVYQWCRENLADMPSLENQLGYLESISGGSFERITEENLGSVKGALQEYINRINDAYSTRKAELDTLQQELGRLEEEIKNLRQGIKAFPPAITELKNLIAKKLSAKHQRDIKPQVFADLLEIRSDKWRNAIEGYLNTQKFYLIVEPEYFIEALKIYDEFKFTRKIYNVGIVDIEKIMAENPRLRAFFSGNK